MKASRYCLYGKPFEDIEESEGVGKKPLSIDQQVVTDEKGRRRFHGAFTGGFSAGYFNTVDTKEGWLPSTFKSTRSQRHQQKEQRPEQFMDSEDFSEFGIAPREIKTTVRYSDDSAYGPLGKEELRRKMVWDPSELMSEAQALADLIKPTSQTFGVNLLVRMGWRPGRGIGSKVGKRPAKSAKPASGGSKLYGCALPPELQEKYDDMKGAEEAAEVDVTISMDDVGAFTFEVKGNQHGLGYKPLQSTGVLTEDVLLKYTGIPGVKSSRGISGQAFGVGAFEDDDPDVYQTDDLSKFDFTSEMKAISSGATDALSDEFVLSTRKTVRRNEYPPPEIPQDFVSKGVELSSKDRTVQDQRTARTAHERRFAFSDGISVFDLLSTADRERLLRIKRQTEAGEIPSADSSVGKERSPSPEKERDFRAFPDDPSKQARFNRFIDYTRRERSMPCPAELTEDQWKSECVEFASLLPADLRPSYEMAKRNSEPLVPPSLSVVSRYFAERLSSKFTRGSGGSVGVEEDVQTDKEKAVGMKMFGMLTRETYKWHPEKQLCKRFNVPDPYPESHLVGVPLLQKKTKPASAFESEIIPTALAGSTKSQETSIKETAHRIRPPPAREATPARKPIPRSPKADRETVEEVEQERPSADLFKAIFAASESEAESEDEPAPSAEQKEDIISALFTSMQRASSPPREQQVAFPSSEQVIYPSPERSPTYGPPLPPDASEFEESAWLLMKSRYLLEKTRTRSEERKKKRHKKKHKKESHHSRHGKSSKERRLTYSPGGSS